jgi:hypothetical protein
VSAVIACVDNTDPNCGSSHVSTLGKKGTVLGASGTDGDGVSVTVK